MPRNAGTVLVNNFQKGLITEATGLNFPENAVTDSLNVVFNREGSVERRNGIDLEPDADVLPFSSQGIVREFIWNAVANNGGFTFLVLQVGQYIRFYEITTNKTLSAGVSYTEINLASYRLSPDIMYTPASFTNGAGYLFIAHPACTPIIVRWDETSKRFEAAAVDIYIRDLEGVEDGLGVSENPPSLSQNHYYNLLNQGWDQMVRVGAKSNEIGAGGTISDWDPPNLNWTPVT